MGKSSGSPPAAPDPYATANAQGAANEATARVQGKINNPNIYSPLGSQTVSWGEGTPDTAGYDNAVKNYNTLGFWGPDNRTTIPSQADFMNPADQPTITQSLSPQGQVRFDQEQRIVGQLGGLAEQGLGRVGEAIEKPFDMSGAPDMVTSVGDYAMDRQRVEDAMMARLNPQLERDEASLRQRLSNQGLTQTHEAYGADMDAFGRERNDARLAAIMGAGQEQSRLFSQGLANANLTNQGRQQGIQEQAFMRGLPLNEINALRSGSQVNMPQFQQYQGAGSIQPPQIQQAINTAYGQNLGNYNANQAQNASFTNGLMSLAGTAGMLAFSDRRLKSNVARVGSHPLGIGVYEYDIFSRRERGVMADEVLAVRPEAVHQHPSGYLMVDYGALA